MTKAEQGDAEAQHRLGWMYADGETVPQDDKQATYWFQKAAEQGHARAQLTLGYRYIVGIGIPQDDKQATYWFQKAAEQGHARAQLTLGYRYIVGIGIPRDDKQAAYWYQKAAEQGHIANRAAQFFLMMAAVAEGNPDIQAFLAGYGHAAVQFDLGGFYYRDDSVFKDHRQAVYWYRKSAEQGYARAQAMLGVMYMTGSGVPEDDVQALRLVQPRRCSGYRTGQRGQNDSPRTNDPCTSRRSASPQP